MNISIHAPRAGCDPYNPERLEEQEYFNPRTPCGVRPNALRHVDNKSNISIHAPRAGCDYELV